MYHGTIIQIDDCLAQTLRARKTYLQEITFWLAHTALGLIPCILP